MRLDFELISQIKWDISTYIYELSRELWDCRTTDRLPLSEYNQVSKSIRTMINIYIYIYIKGKIFTILTSSFFLLNFKLNPILWVLSSCCRLLFEDCLTKIVPVILLKSKELIPNLCEAILPCIYWV